MELSTNEIEFTIEDYRMALATARYEKEYEKALTRATQIFNIEHSRTQRMEQLFLQTENENLQLQLDQKSRDLDQVKQAESDTRLQLHDTSKELARLQNVIEASTREMENLRRELATLSGAAFESKNLLAEKIRLSKDISNLQSEVERLRSQNISFQSLLGEKQALDRQLNTLEVQLEHEKRAHERTLAKGTQQMEEIAKLNSKLEKASREVDTVRRQRQSNLDNISVEPTADGKVRGMNKKSNSMEDQRQEFFLDMPQQQNDRNISKTKDFTEKSSSLSLQRSANRVQAELTIATPGAIRTQDHQKRYFALPGDKSSFSITPFLNRTTGLEESTLSSDDEVDELQTIGENTRPTEVSDFNERGQNTVAESRQLISPALTKLSTTANQGLKKTNADVKERNPKKARIVNNPGFSGEVGGPDALTSHVLVQKAAQNRKRKLGLQRDRSLFEEEGDDEEISIFQDARKPGRRLVGAAQTAVPGYRVFTGLGGFSPLKRDKKRF